MTDHVQLDTVCPNNHNLTVAFTRKAFEAAVKSDSLVFHCNTCEADWNPSKKQIAEIREKLGEK